MKQFENEFGGQIFCLRGNDRIDDLPQSMRSLILPHVEDAFADPRHVFERVAMRTELSNLATYLRKLISNNEWQLVVEDAYVHKRVTRVGFYWHHQECYPATFVLREKPSNNKLFAKMFDMIDETCWDRVGCAGGILPTNSFHSLVDCGIIQNAFPPETNPVIFGTESKGDVFVFCSDNRAGMISHETGDVVEFDSVSECCEWILAQLLAGSPPEFNWRAVQSDDDDESDPPFQLRLRRPDE